MAERSEMTRVEASAFALPRPERARETRTSEDLHVCPACASELVYPTDWSPVAPAPASATRRWSVELRCPECEWTGGGTYTQPIVDRFDEVLDNGTEALLEDLNLLTRANMEDQIDRFTSALERDAILPEDF